MDYSDFLGERDSRGGIRKMPKRFMRSSAYVPTDALDLNGVSYVDVSASQFVVFPPGRISEEDGLLIAEVQASLLPVEEPKRKKQEPPESAE